MLYPARLSFRIEGEIKNFSDKQKLKKKKKTIFILLKLSYKKLNKMIPSGRHYQKC